MNNIQRHLRPNTPSSFTVKVAQDSVIKTKIAYELSGFDAHENPSIALVRDKLPAIASGTLHIVFNQGNRGSNGVTPEMLLAVVGDYLEKLNSDNNTKRYSKAINLTLQALAELHTVEPL